MIGLCLSLALISLVSSQNTTADSSNLLPFCKLQPDAGSPICSFNQDRFFYNLTSEACEPFKYTGCLGNKNRFTTIEECKNECKNTKDDIPENLPRICIRVRNKLFCKK